MRKSVRQSDIGYDPLPERALVCKPGRHDRLDAFIPVAGIVHALVLRPPQRGVNRRFWGVDPGGVLVRC